MFSVFSPYTIQGEKNLEKIQKRATKLVNEIKHLSCVESSHIAI